MTQPVTDPFLLLRATVEAELPGGAVLAVGCALAGDGTPVVAAGLAAALAAAGYRTLALDAAGDGDPAPLRARLGTARAPAVTLDAATNDPAGSVAHPAAGCDCLVLQAGSLEAAGAPALSALFAALRGRYDYAVVDVATIAAGGLGAARAADGVLLAVRENRAAANADRDAAALLAQVGAHVLGVVATSARRAPRRPAAQALPAPALRGRETAVARS